MASSYFLKEQNLLYGVHHSLEGSGVIHGQVGQYFSVEFYVMFVNLTHEGGIAHAMLTGTGIDSLNPQAAELTLSLLAIPVSVQPRLFNLIFGYSPYILLTPEVALGKLHHALSSGSRGYVIY